MIIVNVRNSKKTTIGGSHHERDIPRQRFAIGRVQICRKTENTNIIANAKIHIKTEEKYKCSCFAGIFRRLHRRISIV